MWFFFPLLCAFGFFLPGYFVARRLDGGFRLASAFVISLLVLFHTVFWLGIAGAPIVLWSVLPFLVVLTCGLAWLARAAPASHGTSEPPAALDRALVAGAIFVGAVLLARVVVSPLLGYDTRFRWDFLAQRILALGSFDFYPPLTPADFHKYFYVDAIPPTVSFAHWWLYASAGRYWPALISLFAAAEFACTLAFTYGAGAALFSRRAGFLAATVLAATPLYFHAVLRGPDSALTTLAVAAMIYFIAAARDPEDLRGMIAAGLAAALCALAREYGWVALPAGIVAILWSTRSLKASAVFALAAAAVAAPWYARTWILSGNPFYSLGVANFAVNPIHAGILQFYYSHVSWHHWDRNTWTAILRYLALWAPLQITVGIIAAALSVRRHGYLAVIVLIFAAVWIEAAGYTSGGIGFSMRVLSPALVALSIAGAGLLESFTRHRAVTFGIALVVLSCQAWTAAYGIFYPVDPRSVAVRDWPRYIFQPVAPDPEFQLRDEFIRLLPPPSRILTDSANLHAALVDSGIDVVPVWSPEVRFLFSKTISFEEIAERLESLRITAVVYYPKSANSSYLRSSSSFYATLAARWRVLTQLPSVFLIYVPPAR